MSDIIKELKKTHVRVTTALNELESLEDNDEGFHGSIDYGDIYVKYSHIMHELERRREQLQKRGRTQ